VAAYLRPVYRRPAFEQFYEQNVRYRIFVHQAILSGAALSLLEPGEFLCCRGATTTRCICNADFPLSGRPRA